jgi:uncharacterized membrane protein YeaQ/YmgE (transglycosylase-associated protein family)
MSGLTGNSTCLIVGAITGVLLYDPVFPEIEATFGETLADILLGAVGALFAAIAYETVEMFADRTGTR